MALKNEGTETHRDRTQGLRRWGLREGGRVLSALACLRDKPRGQAEGREEIWLQAACRLQKVPHVKDLNLILRFRESLKDCEIGDDRDKRVAEDGSSEWFYSPLCQIRIESQCLKSVYST